MSLPDVSSFWCYDLSHVIRIPVYVICKQQSANQPANSRSLISTIVFRCLDSILPLVSLSENLSLYIAAQASLCLTWSETPKTCFLVTRLIYACGFSCATPIWAAAWQNRQNECAPSEDSDQVSSCGQGRLWSDWADAQAVLNLRWAHGHLVGFVMSRFKLFLNKLKMNARGFCL